MKISSLKVWDLHAIVMDNGKQFDSKGYQKFCGELGIKYQFSSLIHP